MVERETEDRHGEKGYFGHALAETTRKGRYALVLLGVCAVAFAGVTLTLIMAGRSLVWDTDGRLLYFPFMVAEGEWLRDIAASLLAGDLTVPLYSFDIGFGADWLITASGNSNEPINFLAALCPPEASEWLYDALVFLRFYLAALTFSFYCFSRGKGKGATLVGALCYVLCGYVLFWGVLRHPNFIDFAILLPLVFMGADKLFVGKNPLLLIASVAGIFMYSIYFAYMTCLFLLAYCLITYFVYPRERSVGDFALLAGKFALCLLAGFALVGFSTIPMFITLTSMGRVGIVREIAFFQTADFYESFASVLLGNHEAQNASVLGAIPVIAILALFVARGSMDERERRAWGCGIALCLIGALVAKVGSVFNGFGYPTDRWEVIFGFCAAYAVVLLVPAIPRFSALQWRRLTALVTVVAVWALAYAFKEGTLLGFATVVMFAGIYGALALWAFFRRRAAGSSPSLPRVLTERCLRALLILAVVANATVHVGLFMSPLGSSYYKEFIRTGHVWGTREQLDLSPALDQLDDAYRINRTDTTYGRNGSFVHGYKGFDFYSSFYNQAVDDFRQSMGLSDDVKSTMFDGTRQRAALDYVLGAKYYISSTEAADLIPDGYVKIADLGEAHNGLSYELYETDRALPLAFTYDSTVTQKDYEGLDLVQRQELLTRALVLAVDEAEGTVPQLDTQRERLGVVEAEGAAVQNGRIVVTKKNASVTFSLSGRAGCETYLCFEGLRFRSLPVSDAERLADEPQLASADLVTNPSFAPAKTCWVTVSDGVRESSFEIATSASPKYAGKEDWAVNLGAGDDPVASITVTFGGVGVYEFAELYGATQSVEVIRENAERLREGNAASVVFENDAMTVSVGAVDSAAARANREKSRYVFVSVPYSGGWSATMDGEPVEILKANVGFMAVEVDGEGHELRFSYVTPGLDLGLASTGATVVLLGTFELGWIRRRRTGTNLRGIAEKEPI